VIDRSLDIEAQTKALLEPGEIELVGAIVDTDLPSDQDLEMMELTVELGDLIAEHIIDEPTYVYSGNDDSRFASNLHQGLTIAEDAFVWECQQLLVEGTFTIVFYFENNDRFDTIIEEIDTAGYDVTEVTTD